MILHESQDLDNSLRSKLDSRLLVLRGKPHEVLPTVVERWGASLLTFERDTEPYAVQRDGKIQEELPSGVEVETCSSHTLWDMDRIKAVCRGKPSTSYQPFLKKVFKALGAPPKPVDAPEKGTLGGCDEWTQPEDGQFGRSWWNRTQSPDDGGSQKKSASTSVSASSSSSSSDSKGKSSSKAAGDWRDEYDVPTLRECGYEEDGGGEEEEG